MIPPLWTHQIEGLAFALPKPATMIGACMGTGKGTIASHAIARWQCKRVLIICPPSVRAVWRRTLPQHCPTEIRPIILDHGSVAERTSKADSALQDPTPAAIVVNTEAIWREPLARWILSCLWDCVILDESHLGGIKTDGSRASEFVADLTPISGHRLCLTGTPLAHDPTNVWGQYRFLDPRIFGPDYAAFLARFAAPKQVRRRKRLRKIHDSVTAAIAELWGPDSPLIDTWGDCPDYTTILPGIRNAAEFAERIAPVTWRCESADVLDLPPLIQDRREVELGPEARRVYDALEREFTAEVNGSQVSINSLLTLQIRLQQISSGFLPDDSGRVNRIDTAKRDALRDLLHEAGEPTIVFCRFRADLDTVEQVAKAIGLRYAELSGRRKDALTDLATLRDVVDVAGVQPQSGGAGIDLSAARIGVWYSLARSLPQYDQAIARLHRPGTKGTRIYSIVATNTIDAELQSAITDRREVIDGILARLRRLALQTRLTCGIIPETSTPARQLQGG
jgi:SNF2 family DNA or RNA helicase